MDKCTSYHDKTDEEVLAASVTHPHIFEILIKRYQVPFERKAARIIGRREEVYDVVQDTFVKIYANAARFKKVSGATFSSWGYKILINTALTYYGKLKKEGETLIPLEKTVIEDVGTISERDGIVAHTYFENEIVAVCSKMPRTLARFFIRYFIEGESYKEIAQTENMTEGSVKTRISRAKKEFKRLLLASESIY